MFNTSAMRTFKTLLTALLCSLAMVVSAQDAPKPDNTKANKGDGRPGAITADQQKTNASDQDVTKNIRRSIMADKSLSTYAHNVKIITQNGAVTLKGPVKSDSEKQSVVAKAVAVAGADKVTDQLSVAP
jgi:hyperosmotically inducible protein